MAYIHLSKGGKGRACRPTAPATVIQERLVEVPVTVEVVKEVVVERPVEVIKYLTETVDKPVEVEVVKTVYVEKPVEVIREVIKEVPVTVEKIVTETVHVKTFAYRVPVWAYVAFAVLVTTNILSLVLR